MIGWILGLVSQTANGINGLAADVAKKIVGVYTFTTTFFSKVKSFLVTTRNRVLGWIHGIEDAITSAYRTVQWVITTWIPNTVRDAIARIYRAILAVIQKARDYAKSLYDIVLQWAKNTIGALSRRLSDFVSWATRNVGTLISNVSRLLHQVFDILGTPSRVVAWILSPLISAVSRWFLSNLERLARAAWQILPSLILSGASIVERTITRII